MNHYTLKFINKIVFRKVDLHLLCDVLHQQTFVLFFCIPNHFLLRVFLQIDLMRELAIIIYFYFHVDLVVELKAFEAEY